MIADTPAYVQNSAFIANGVKVHAGTNWDISRTAVATPLVALPDPEPVTPPIVRAPRVEFTEYIAADQIPLKKPDVSVQFIGTSTILSIEAKAKLKALDKCRTYIVAGHSDLAEKNSEVLSRQRANVVAEYLKRQRIPVKVVKSFGSRRLLDQDSSTRNSRVDIISR